MSREVPTVGLHWYHRSSLGCWCCGISHCESRHSNHQKKTDGIELIPCKRRPRDWLVGIACWRPLLGPWLAVLEAHWLAFGVGKWHLLIRKQDLWSSHSLHKPSCSLHLLFEIQAVPVESKSQEKFSVHNKLDISESSSCIVNCNGQSLSVWSFLC